MFVNASIALENKCAEQFELNSSCLRQTHLAFEFQFEHDEVSARTTGSLREKSHTIMGYEAIMIILDGLVDAGRS